MHTHDPLTELRAGDLSARACLHYAKHLLLTGTRHAAAVALRDELGPTHPATDRFQKASASALTSSTDTHAWRTLLEPLAKLLRRKTVLGQLAGTLRGVAGLRTPVLDASSIVSSWSVPYPAMTLVNTPVQSRGSSFGFIVGASAEYLRSAGDVGVQVLERQLLQIAPTEENRYVLDSEAATDDRPAGLLYGLTAAGGGSADQIDADTLQALAEVREDLIAPAWITSPGGAAYLAGLGELMFRDVGLTGGALLGAPLILSKAAENRLILIDGAAVVVADNGLTLDSADSASVVLDTAPGSPANLVSGWQTDTRLMRVVRYLDWQLTHADAVSFVELPIMAGGSPA